MFETLVAKIPGIQELPEKVKSFILHANAKMDGQTAAIKMLADEIKRLNHNLEGMNYGFGNSNSQLGFRATNAGKLDIGHDRIASGGVGRRDGAAIDNGTKVDGGGSQDHEFGSDNPNLAA